MYYQRKSLTFEVLEFGKPDKQPVVLLHGFPASAASWTLTAERLAAAGHYVLVPEQRGYSKDARPTRRRDYRLSELTMDIATLLEAAGAEKAHIAGHDWGGIVAWAFAAKYPEKTLSLTAISTPHPKALLGAVLKSKQIFLSWYIFVIQLPWLPEFIITARNNKLPRKILTGSGLEADIATKYAVRMEDREYLKGALGWYRAVPFTVPEIMKLGPITVPVLLVYGHRDKFLSKKAVLHTRDWVSGEFTYLELPNATHWLPEEAPTWIADQIIKHVN